MPRFTRAGIFSFYPKIKSGGLILINPRQSVISKRRKSTLVKRKRRQNEESLGRTGISVREGQVDKCAGAVERLKKWKGLAAE